MPTANGEVDVTRREHEDIAHTTRENSRELAALGEWRKHQDQSLGRFFSKLDGIESLITSAVEIGKQGLEIAKQASLGLVDVNNRISRGDIESVENGKRLSRTENDLLTLRRDHANLQAAHDAQAAEMKTSIGLRKEFSDAQDTIKELKAAEKVNTEARVILETRFQTISSLIRWLIALAPLIGVAVGVATFYGLAYHK